MNLILLHGAAGIWDEVACLVIPATAIMGVALAVLRERSPADEDDESDDDEAVVDEESGEQPAEQVRREESE